MYTFGLVALAVTVFGIVAAHPKGYGGDGGHLVQPGPAVEYAYPAKAPQVKCSHNLLVSCNPHHSVVSCKAHEHSHGGYGGAHVAPAHHESPASGHDYEAAEASHGNGDQYRHKKHKKHHKWHKKHHGHGWHGYH